MDVDPPAELQHAPTAEDEFALGTGEALHTGPPRPPWLINRPPKKPKLKWPDGAKSPSWFKRFALCPLQHAERYRRNRPDPSGVAALVGTLIHGAIEDAVTMRIRPGNRGQIPPVITRDELLYLLTWQKEAVRQPDLSIAEGAIAEAQITTEVMARAREIVQDLDPIDVRNVWATEHTWCLPITSSLKIAGVADLLQVQPHPTDPRHPPLEVTITDWKTGEGQLPTKNELELDPQATLQLAWAKRKFPDTPRVRFRIVNLALQAEVSIDWSLGLEQLAMGFAASCYNLWEAHVEDANTGSHCARCAYRHGCNPYTASLRRAAYAAHDDDLESMSLQQLLPVFYQAKVLHSMAEQRKKDAGKLILAHLGRQQEHRHGQYLAKKRNKRMPAFMGQADLISKLADIGGQDSSSVVDRVTKVNKKDLEAYVATLPLEAQAPARALVDKHQTLNSTPYWVEVSIKEPLF